MKGMKHKIYHSIKQMTYRNAIFIFVLKNKTFLTAFKCQNKFIDSNDCNKDKKKQPGEREEKGKSC